MNHVPNDVVDAIDEFGESLLLGEPCAVSGRLRQDLRLNITPTDTTTATCRYATEHTQTPPTLRERGSFVTTIVDAIDTQLRAWGVTPPSAYRYTTTVGNTHYYDGTLELP